MALTFSRWIVVIVLLCVGAAVALLPVPPRDSDRRFIPGESTRLQRVTGELNRARQSLRISALADTILDMARRSPLPSGGPPTVVDLGAATREEREAFREVVSRWWPTSGLDTSVAVALVLGGETGDVTWQVQHMLPASGDGRTCVTLVPTQTWKEVASRRARSVEFRFASELGTCLVMAMYGRPGPRIEQWLAGRGLDFMGYFHPTGRVLEEDTEFFENASMHNSLFALAWALYGPDALMNCAKGLLDQCARAVAIPDSSRPIPRGFHPPLSPWRSAFGNLTSAFLFDLHRQIGPEQFRELWHSSETLDQAIQGATGTSLGEWTHQWALGRREGYRPGPLPEERSVVRVAGLTLLLLGAAIGYSVRRTVA